MNKIKLTQGKYTLVDDEDFEELNKLKWRASRGGRKSDNFYAVRSFNNRHVIMHRLIMDCPEGLEIDHINGNGLDNRRNNLRVCTRQENMSNYKTPKNNTSGYKGVCWYKERKKWGSQIKVNQKIIFLGLYEDKKEAAFNYNQAAIKHFGRFAKLNNI